MRRTIATLLLGLLLATRAIAQDEQQSPADARAAISAAEAALGEAQARSGASVETANLALDLATLQLDAGDRAAAASHAQSALQIVTAAGGDAARAQLLLARASVSQDIASRERLATTLQSVAERSDLSKDVYLAAADLGRSEMRSGRFSEAAFAWGLASRHAESADGDTVAARASATALEGVALFYVAVRQRPIPGVRDEEIAAHARLHEAMRLTMPALTESAPGEAMSPQVRINAMARAWHTALDARHADIEPPWRGEDGADITRTVASDVSYCPARLIAQPLPRYPPGAEFGLRVGAVVMRFHFSENGEIIRRELAAAAPASGAFTNAVTTAAERWRVEWSEEAPPGCSKAYVLSSTIRFQFPS